METKKAEQRRIQECFFEKYIRLPGLDIGCGEFWTIHPDFDCFDKRFGHGNAELLPGIHPNSYNTVYASHILEHLLNPIQAVQKWTEALRLNGHLIIVVPHRDLYEMKTNLPSFWNPDHKTFWLPYLSDPPHTLSLFKVVKKATGSMGEIKSLRTLCDNWKHKEGSHPKGEYSIEIIIRKTKDYKLYV